MRVITKYQSNDGAQFDSAADAEKRDRLVDRVNSALTLLKSKPSWFKGYIQQDYFVAKNFKAAIIEMAKTECPDPIWNEPIDKINPMGWAGRLLDESSPPLYRAWHRVMCIDEHGREWEQPYYVLNPQSRDMVEYNGQ